MRIRVLVAAAAVVTTAMVGAAPAEALPPKLTTTAVTPPGAAISVTLSHFGATEAVELDVDITQIALVVTKAAGSWSGTVTLPPSVVAGRHVLTATGRHSGLAAQVAFTVRSDWPQQAFGPDHESASPYESILSTTTVRKLRQRWDYPDAAASSTPGSPTVVSGIVYGLFGLTVRAVDATTGVQVWSQSVGQAGDLADTHGSVSVVAGVAYVASDQQIWALDARTGAVEWVQRVTTDDLFGGLVVGGGIVAAAGLNGILGVYHADTGAPAWRKIISGVPAQAPTYADGRLYLAATTDLFAWNAADGTLLWDVTRSGGGVLSPIDVVDRTVICACSNLVSAYRAATGALLWSYDLHAVVNSAIAVADGLVLAGDVSGYVTALSYADGSVVWSSKATQVSTGIEGSVEVANGVVYATGRTTTALLDLGTGALVRTLGVGARYGGAAVVDGAVYTKDAVDGGLFRYDLPSSP